MAAIRKAKIRTEQSRSKLKNKPIVEEQIKNKNYRLEQEKNMEGGCRNRIPGVDREGPTTVFAISKAPAFKLIQVRGMLHSERI